MKSSSITYKIQQCVLLEVSFSINIEYRIVKAYAWLGSLSTKQLAIMKKKMLLAFSPVNSRFCFLFFSFFLITVGVYAQTVKGTVSDNESKPVSGATVSVKGTSKATATNAAGSFSINAASNDTIVVSYVGFVPRKYQ